MKRCLLFMLLLFIAVFTVRIPRADAALIQATYSIEAGEFVDSNNNPPTSPTTNYVTGSYTFISLSIRRSPPRRRLSPMP